MTQYKLLILRTACQFSSKAWLYYDMAFRNDTAVSGLTDWSHMNSDLYNFHTRNSSSLLQLHPHLHGLPLHRFSADPGLMAPVPGPKVNVGTVTAVRIVKESILVSTAPFGPQCRILSSCGPLPLHGANTRGVETVTRNNAYRVQLCCSFSSSYSLFPVPVNVVVSFSHVSPASSRPQGLPAPVPGTPCSDPLSSMCLVASTSQQDLLLPSRVTPIEAQKLWRELCFHPDQVKVDHVITGLTSGFCLGFDPLGGVLTVRSP